MADLDTGLLTENVHLDDIGQGQTQLLAPIRVQDVLTVIRVSGGDISLTEHVLLDDSGQGRTELHAPIRVQDVLTVQRVSSVGNLEFSLTEHVRVVDASDSWAQLGTEEFILVRDTLSVQRGAPYNVSPGVSSVRLTAIGILLGLGGRVRDIFVNEAFTQLCLPLAEQSTLSAIFHDISGKGNDATLSGSGATRGVGLGLPEQAMGLTSGGSVVLSVPDDGVTTGGINLANGSMDIAGFFITSASDATERLIITNRNGSLHGWYVGIVSGTIRFRLRTTGGVDVFNFTRGSIADGLPHVFHCYYDPPTQEARVFIDGVQVGATVSTTNTDPEYIGAGIKIMGGDPGGASGFIGTLGFIDLGREGNIGLCALLQAARLWTDVGSAGDKDVRMRDGVRGRYGSSGRLVTDWVASSGTCSFVLENSIANSVRRVGYYSPNHANCRAGFALGIPVEIVFTYGALVRCKFTGRIIAIAPDTGPLGSRGVRVTAADWLDVAARSRYIGAEAQIGQLSTDVLKYLIDQADQSPGGVSIDLGTQVFGYALDQGRGERDTILSEFGRLAPSEAMYLFMRGNPTTGMTFVASTRFARAADQTLDATFTDTMSALDLSVDTGAIINEVRATCYPPTIDAAATSVLFSLTATALVGQPIQAGKFVTIDAPYTDPNDRPSSIGGTALVTPVATTDYTGNSLADGTGTDRTASLSVTAMSGASAARIVVTNNYTDTVYLTKLQLRGKGIYRYLQAPAVAVHQESIEKYGTSPLDLDMPYQQSVGIAQSLANDIRDIYGLPTTRPMRMTLPANRDDERMTQALTREIGDRVGVEESVSGLVAGEGYYINEVEFECFGLHSLRVTHGLIPPWPQRLLVSYTGPAGTQTHDLDAEPLVLTDNGDYTFEFNRTGDTIQLKGVAGGGGGANGSADSGEVNTAAGGGGGGGAVQLAGLNVAIAVTSYTGKVGVFGAAGIGDRGSGSPGGTTEFRVPAGTIHLQLPGGGGGSGSADGTTGGAAGTASGAGTGSGNVGGTAGGRGGDANVNNDTAGTNNATGAAGGGGGGGGGSTVSAGSAGGSGIDQSGGAGGAAANPGVSASGSGGDGNGSSSGGGGGGGGGALHNSVYRGGGGGGAAGGANVLLGGDGGGGILIITKV